jgi:predicted HicB family RNase H-like nuclease
MKLTSVRMSEELHRHIKVASATLGISMQDFVTNAIRRALADKNKILNISNDKQTKG